MPTAVAPRPIVILITRLPAPAHRRNLTLFPEAGVRQIEMFPMSKANEALAHREAGKARYRIVLEANA